MLWLSILLLSNIQSTYGVLKLVDLSQHLLSFFGCGRFISLQLLDSLVQFVDFICENRNWWMELKTKRKLILFSGNYLESGKSRLRCRIQDPRQARP
jgi:hypothetical protein